MRVTLASLALLGTVCLACGSSSPTSPTSAAPIEFRVMTFNIQHGLSGAGQYGLHYAIDTIAAVNPDVVGVQELTQNHPFYKCEDQPAMIAQGLKNATGRDWSYVYKKQWDTKVFDCNGQMETEGIGFFAAMPTDGVKSEAAWNGGLGVLVNLRAGRGVPIIVTHLAPGTDHQGDRLRQLDTLMPWTQGQGAWRIFVGDFNFSPQSTEYQQVHATYRDAWADALAAGTAKGKMDGITHKSNRIDYIFYAPGDALELKSVETIDTRALVGTETSDHFPVVATFRVK